MKGLDLAGAIVAPVVWGLVFIAVKYGVEEAPPFLLTALRFGFAALPFAFFVKPPAAPALQVVLYGAFIGIGQFGLLFLGVREGMPVGLASLVIQSQAYFTVLFAAIVLGERPTRPQWIGGAVAFAGMIVIGATRWGDASLWPFALTLAAAVCWGAGNVVGKRIGRVDALSFVVWTSLVAPLPMAALSFWLEPQRTLAALTHPSLKLALCVAALAYAGTLLAYGLWARLLSRYSSAAVAPFALLVPVIGMITARVLFDEALTPVELLGAALVMAGLAFNVLGARLLGVSRRLPA